MAEIGGIEHVNVTVRDVRASAAWYAELLDRGVHRLKGVPKGWRLFAVERGSVS